ncbi:MAG: hypothetical protein OEN56_03005 [Gemmatimonadota bacterium]|nr:hypothetical protein [Gemmatimonadota bacterium]
MRLNRVTCGWRRISRGVVLGATTVATLLAVDGHGRSLTGQEEQPTVQSDPLFATLFPPELIMQHRRAIGLDEAQRGEITRLISDLQGRVLSLQWELSSEVEELAAIMGRPRVDLDRALDQMDAVLDREKEIKQAHLEMLVRIKNLLRPEQQARLEELRRQARGG